MIKPGGGGAGGFPPPPPPPPPSQRAPPPPKLPLFLIIYGPPFNMNEGPQKAPLLSPGPLFFFFLFFLGKSGPGFFKNVKFLEVPPVKPPPIKK